MFLKTCEKIVHKSGVQRYPVHCVRQPLRHSSKQYGSEETKKSERNDFAKARHGNFRQVRPVLANPFLSDAPLRSFLDLHVPKEVNNVISQDLSRFGERVVSEIDDLGWECEVNPPQLETQDAWGERVDRLTTCSAWKKQHDIVAEEGIVSIPYEKKLNEWSRLHQVCKLYLYSPSSGLYSCPVAMTDGAAKTIQSGKESILKASRDRLEKAFVHLTTRDPEQFWSSGQWMTEKRGGSDVANSTETIAVPDDGFFRLYGYKWFSSASDANMALTLARVTDPSTSETSSGLDMFYVELRNPEGQLNNIQMVRLKNKLGTRQLPTAELLLDGSVAHRMSDNGRGIASISNMLNVTRLHNSISAVAAMRRILMLSRDYSYKREAFGLVLAKIPLHVRVLSTMEMEVRGSLLLLLKTAVLLGKMENNIHTEDEMLLLRLISPVLKLYTAKQAMAVVSEGLESLGGQGYMEDTKFPVFLRDAQVLPIWEGTTNVLSLDIIRSLVKTNFEVLSAFDKDVLICLESGKKLESLSQSCNEIEKSVKYLLQFISKNPDLLTISARDIAYTIARSYIGALLVQNAVATNRRADIFLAQQWCKSQILCPVSNNGNYYQYNDNDLELVMDGYIKG